SHSGQADPPQTQMTVRAADKPMLHESFVGWDLGLARLCCAARFLRGFFGSSFGFFTFALTKAGGGVFCFSNSSIRLWATRNCSLTRLQSLQGFLELGF